MTSQATSNASLLGQKICLVGQFVTMTHADLGELIRAHGGRWVRSPSRRTSLVVVGGDGWPCRRDGSVPRLVEQVQALHDRGHRIKTIFEAEFFESLGLVDQQESICRELNLADMARLLTVPPTHIRRWMRLGLVRPTRTVYRLHYFDVTQVTNARRICRLLSSGATLADIRRGLERLQRWLPRRELPLSQLAVLEHDGRLLVRLNGVLAEPTGQLRFDFEPQGESAVQVLAIPPEAPDVDALFDQALELEDAGQFDRAAEYYRRAIGHEASDPVLHFNLGNVLFGLKQYGEAAESYRRALDLDGNYAEAWNNLGNTYVQLDRWSEAIQAFRRALRLIPDYSDARQSLNAAMQRLRTRRSISLVEH